MPPNHQFHDILNLVASAYVQSLNKQPIRNATCPFYRYGAAKQSDTTAQREWDLIAAANSGWMLSGTSTCYFGVDLNFLKVGR